MPLFSGCGQNIAHAQLWPYQFNSSSYATDTKQEQWFRNDSYDWRFLATASYMESKRSFVSMSTPGTSYRSLAEVIGHDFRELKFLFPRTVYNVRFLLTQRVDLGCGGVHRSLWKARTCALM